MTMVMMMMMASLDLMAHGQKERSFFFVSTATQPLLQRRHAYADLERVCRQASLIYSIMQEKDKSMMMMILWFQHNQ